MLIAVEVTALAEDGEVVRWSTEIHGPFKKAQNYFSIGKEFNIGGKYDPTLDRLVSVTNVKDITEDVHTVSIAQ